MDGHLHYFHLEINDECQPIDVCDFLYQNQPTICVTIGSTTFSCVCTFNNTGVRCEDVPGVGDYAK